MHTFVQVILEDIMNAWTHVSESPCSGMFMFRAQTMDQLNDKMTSRIHAVATKLG